MNNAIIQLLILAAVAVFLVFRLKNLLGTREGFEGNAEKTVVKIKEKEVKSPNLEIINGGLDHDIVDHVEKGSKAAKNLSIIKGQEPNFNVREFLSGAREAYEMILVAFKSGDISSVKTLLSEDVKEAFLKDIENRKIKGLKTNLTFGGIRALTIVDADFDQSSSEVEITIRFLSDLTIVVKNDKGNIVEGSENDIKVQKDVWTFGRTLTSKNPNWSLIATEL